MPTTLSGQLANPFLRCEDCGERVERFSHLGSGQGPAQNEPCGHASGYTSVCPSWGPVDGCQCVEHLGHVDHEPTLVAAP